MTRNCVRRNHTQPICVRKTQQPLSAFLRAADRSQIAGANENTIKVSKFFICIIRHALKYIKSMQLEVILLNVMALVDYVRVCLEMTPSVMIRALKPPLFSNACSNSGFPESLEGRLQGVQSSTPSMITSPTLNLFPTRLFN